jgi:hypothetical protein
MLDETFLAVGEPVVVLVGTRVPPPDGAATDDIHLQVSEAEILGFDKSTEPLFEELDTPRRRSDVLSWLSGQGVGATALDDDILGSGVAVQIDPGQPPELLAELSEHRLTPLVSADPQRVVRGRIAITSKSGTTFLIWPETAAVVWEGDRSSSTRTRVEDVARQFGMAPDEVARSLFADLNALLNTQTVALLRVGG